MNTFDTNKSTVNFREFEMMYISVILNVELTIFGLSNASQTYKWLKIPDEVA